MKDKPLNSLNAKVAIITVDPGRKLNVHKTFKRRPGRLLNVLCTFNLHPVSTGETDFKKSVAYKKSVYIQLSWIFHLSISYQYGFLPDKYVSRGCAITFEKTSHKKVLWYDSCLVEPQTFLMNLWSKPFS